ncbi:hypothetical protein P5637_07180 [Bacillus paralicheniformis]|uniref:Uncharacterized protein n=1 Tax=Bacillus paralicheniformis TaxID=1648923 RepID=A0ABY3FXT8_9BACI|nr:hypothetical protein [Bacillus paralicheniformis]TWL39531.1 hypothetical protein CHCC15381_4097 [Bacillus paralicheniformis]WEZ25556.1 hypothetical protein P5637_07180 [Bacillus paralicheniformis]
MTILEFLESKRMNRDEDGNEISYEEARIKVVNALGFEKCVECLPASKEEIQEALKNDKYLTKISFERWDSKAPLLYDDLNKMGITQIGVTETVDLLKQCARMWAGQ